MVVGRPSEGTAHVLNMVNRQGKKQVVLDLLNCYDHNYLHEQGRGGGINSLRGEDRQGDGRNGLRGGRNCLRGGRDTWGQSGPHHGATGIVKVTRSAYQQEGGGGTNRIGGKWSSSHGPLCSGSSGNIRETKREAFHVYKEGGINQQRGVSMTAPKSLVGFKELSSVSGSNLSTVPPISKEKPRHQVEASVVEAQPPHVKKNLGSARTLQDSINRSGTVNDFGLQIRAEIRQGLHQTRQNQGTCPGTEMCGQDERLRLLEQRLAKLEQQIVEQKAAEEILLASVERVLAGEEVEEKDLELKLVNLLHHFKRKVQVSEGVASLDVNGNGLTRRNFVSNPLHSDVKQADTSNVARQHPGGRLFWRISECHVFFVSHVPASCIDSGKREQRSKRKHETGKPEAPERRMSS